MNNLNLLVVEGNIKKDSEIFIKAAGASASDNLKKLLLKLQPSLVVEVVHPGNEIEVKSALNKINSYNGIIFTGGAMRINDLTDEIKKHINFANECFNHNKKILAILKRNRHLFFRFRTHSEAFAIRQCAMVFLLNHLQRK